MKKFLCLFLVALMLFSFTACGNSKEKNLETALTSANAYIEKTDKEYDLYSITADYDAVSNTYSVYACADADYLSSLITNEEYFEIMLNLSLKNADSKTEEISLMMTLLKSMITSLFEGLKTETQVKFIYINTDKTSVEY